MERLDDRERLIEKCSHLPEMSLYAALEISFRGTAGKYSEDFRMLRVGKSVDAEEVAREW